MLEDRRLLAIDLSGVVQWIEQGSQPITESSANAPPNDPSSGAVEDLAIDPNDPSHMFAATVNGGIWRTHDGNRPFNGIDDGGVPILPDDPSEQPSWTPVTDQYSSLAMGGIAFDPLDVTGNTVFAGTGSTSSRSDGAGGLPIGIMKTTDDGVTWEVIPLEPVGAEPRVRTIVPTTYDGSPDPGTQQVVLVGTVGSGLYRSIDGGENYAQISGTGVGLPGGTVTDIQVDPNDNSVYYAGVVGDGVFRSDDGGATWTDVNNADLSTNALLGSSTAMMLTAHPGGGTTRVYAMVSYDDDDMGTAEVPQVFTSVNDGASWTELAAVPSGFASTFGSLYAARASDQLLVDPSDQDIVYIAKGYGGSPMIYRYDPSGGGSWDQIEDVLPVLNSRPHVDHRDLQFVNSGGNDVLINANDGGLYFLVDPQSPPLGWIGMHGRGATGLGATEYTNATWDSQFNVVFGGSQDNGTSVQTGTGNRVWESFRGADGGDVQAAGAGGGDSFRYSSTQNFGLTRHRFDSATNETGSVNLVPAGGLVGYDNYFVPQYELNSVNSSRLVTGGRDEDNDQTTLPNNPVYELLNADTATGPGDVNWVAVPIGPGFTNVNQNDDAAFVVGGRMGGVDNEEVLIVASGADIFIRSTAGGTLTVTPTSFPGGNVQAIATDPENWQHIIVADSDQVWETTDAGNAWTEITANLGNVNTRLQSLAYVPTPSGDVVVVGGNLGVSRLTVGDPAAQWTRLGANLPNALVNDLEYHASDDVLLVGSFGRGAWLVENASTVVDDVGVLTICGDEDYINQDDIVRLVRNALNPLILDVFLNSVTPVFSVPLAALNQINVFGVGGNDHLIVDIANGLINIPSGIRYDGDGICTFAGDDQGGPTEVIGVDRGIDTLTLTGDLEQTSETIIVGALPGTGVDTITGPDGVQTVYFEELEPVVTFIPATDLNINGGAIGSLLNASNAINYQASDLLGPTGGMVTIDEFEPIHFTNKANLAIDAEAGNDTINLNNSDTPTDLTTITVDGGDPSGSDQLIIRTAAEGDVEYQPTGQHSGTFTDVTTTTTVNINGIEDLLYDAAGGTEDLTIFGDGLGDESTDAFVFRPGATGDSGRVEIRSQGSSFDELQLLGISYTGLERSGSLEIDGLNDDRDSLLVYGTEASDQLVPFSVLPNRFNIFLDSSSGPEPISYNTILTFNIENYTFETLGGDDLVLLRGPMEASRLSVIGDDSGEQTGDRLLLRNSASDPLDVIIEPDSFSRGQNISGFGADLSATGFEFIEYDARNDGSLTVALGQGNNVARVEQETVAEDFVDGADAISSDSLPLIRARSVPRLIVDPGLGSDEVTYKTRTLQSAIQQMIGDADDTLVIEGSDGAGVGNDVLTVSNPAGGSVAINDSTGSSSVTVTDTGTVGRLQINTLGGDDLVTVDVTNGAIAPLIGYDGGVNSDLLQLIGEPPDVAVDTVSYTVGPQVQAGRITHDDDTDPTNGLLLSVDFENLEPVQDNVPANNLVVTATNADNAINYTAGPGGGIFVGATGLVSIDGFETIEFNNKDNLTINAGAGSDTINLNYQNAAQLAPTGNAFALLQNVNVNAGDPAGGSDTLVFNGLTSVASENIRLNATALGSGVIQNPTNSMSDVNYTGVEDVDIVLQRSQGDFFAVDGTAAGNDHFQVSAGDSAGQYRVVGTMDQTGATAAGPFTLPTIDVLGDAGLGIFNFFNVGGVDSYELTSTNSNDTFNLNNFGRVEHLVNGTLRNSHSTSNVSSVTIEGLAGDDIFNVPGDYPFTLNVNGGNPGGGSDVLNFDGVGAAITADLAARSVTETGFSAVTFNGIETVNIDAAAASLSANLTSTDDELTYRPTAAAAGTFRNEGDSTTFNFTAVSGAFTVNALASVADHVIVQGTGSHDQILVDSPSRTATVTDAAGTTLKTVTLADDVESITAQGRAGNDTVLVVPAPTVGAIANGNLLVNVDGGGPGASDALVVATATGATLPATDFAVNAVGLNPGEGRVRVFRSAVATPDISYTDIEIVSPNVVVTGGVPQLLVLGPDASEPNEFRTTATHLGAGEAINVDNLAIFPNFGEHPNVPADVDFFQIVAETTGTLDVTAFFETYATTLLPAGGQLGINVLDASGNVIAGAGTFGNPDATPNARVRLPAVEGQVYFVTVFGAAADGSLEPATVNGYELSIVNHAPPVPYAIELVDNPTDGTTNPPGTSTNSDTGRSQFDNVTYDDTPTLIFRLDDGTFLNDLPGNPATDTPPDEVIAIPFQAGVAQPVTPGYAIAISDEGDTAPAAGNAGGLQSQQPLGFATQIEPGLYSFTVPGANSLNEGSHFLTARVQMIDPAAPQQTGFGDRSLPLEIIVDRTEPDVFFGLATRVGDGLHPDSDSGDPSDPSTLADRITNDVTPTFFGRAEANAIVRAFVDLDGDDMLTAADLLIGQTVAIPLDGTEQLETPTSPTDPGGQWELTSTVNMNDPLVVAALGFDGVRTILLTAEDLAGNITSPDDPVTLDIFVDTQGPQVTDVYITDVPGFELFDLKPETARPTPRVDRLTIELQDLPARVLPFFYAAVSNVESPNEQLAPIVLVGDHSGPIAIANVTYVDTNSGPGVATGDIILTFSDPLPDDRYTLTLMDNIIDPAGNQLDGENNAAEPVGNPDFPTGDEIPGGDFIARFTIDSRPEVATWSQGVVYADINGNFVWDPEGQDNDATNRDFVFNFGEITDAYFAGNFSSVATSSGFDKLGAYGRFNGVYQFFLDTDDDGVGDLVPSMAFQVNAIPVAGNFFNSAADIAAVAAGQRPRDEIGAFDGQNWYLDVNGNNQIDAGEQFPTNLRGIPLVGDFNGDGFDDLATFNNSTGQFEFDLDRNGTVDDTLTFGFSGFGEKPVAGDYNLDGVDDIGLWVPGRDGQFPKEAGEFHFLLSDRVEREPEVILLPSTVFDPYSPAPLGNDLFAQFGDEFALPLFGNFDPPVTQDGGGGSVVGTLTNELNRFDANVDGRVSALDALVVINALGRGDFSQLSQPVRVVASLGGHLLDVSGDGTITALDALQVINELARQNVTAAGEQVTWAVAADRVIADLDDEDDDLLALLASDLEQQRTKTR